MPEPLSYLSTLEEVISTSDDDLKQGFGYLAPETVMNYVMHLRNKLRTVEKGKEAAEAEVVRLKRVISEKGNNLAGLGDVPATAPPLYDMSIPGPSSTFVPDLTNTGYSQELDVSSQFTGIPPALSWKPSEKPLDLTDTKKCSQGVGWSDSAPGQSSSDIQFAPTNKVVNLGDTTLQPGMKIEAKALFKKGSDKFSISLMKTDGFYIFHLEFRTYPRYSCSVMNTSPNAGRETEVRVDLYRLSDGQLNVGIECGKNKFKVKVNGNYIGKAFPYRYPLKDIMEIKFMNGTNGNKWMNDFSILHK